MKRYFIMFWMAAIFTFLSVSVSAMTSQEEKEIDSAIVSHSGSVSKLVATLLNKNLLWAPDVVAKVMNAKSTVQYPSIVESAFSIANDRSDITNTDNIDRDPKVLLLRAIANQAVKSGMNQDDVVMAAVNAGVDITLLFPTAAGGEQLETTPLRGVRNNRNGNQISPS